MLGHTWAMNSPNVAGLGAAKLKGTQSKVWPCMLRNIRNIAQAPFGRTLSQSIASAHLAQAPGPRYGDGRGVTRSEFTASPLAYAERYPLGGSTCVAYA